jgi:hypothetical protein
MMLVLMANISTVWLVYDLTLLTGLDLTIPA